MAEVKRFVARLMLAAIFLSSGAHKLATFNPQTGGPLAGYMSSKIAQFTFSVGQLIGGGPLIIPQALLPQIMLLSGIMEVVGSALLILGISFGPTLLMAFLMPTTIIMHNFWDMPPASQQHQMEMVNFMKNVGLMGGLILAQAAMGKRRADKEKRA